MQVGNIAQPPRIWNVALAPPASATPTFSSFAPQEALHHYLGFMEAFQQMQGAWSSFGGASPISLSPATASSAPSASQLSGGVDLGPRVEELRRHWVQVLPEAFLNAPETNSEGLSMITMDGRRVPYSPETKGRSVYLDVNTHYPVAGQDGIDKYWEARTADGLDYSKLAVPLMGAEGDRYNDDVVRRLAIDGTSSEIFPAEHLRDNIPASTKRRVDLTYTYSALNSHDSPLHKNATAEEKQNLHEAGKFAIASATFLESGGKFDDQALDRFLSEQLEVDASKLKTGDGPRGERLAKLGEVTKAIIDGEVEISDAVEFGLVPEDQVKKFEASVKTVEHGKIGADVSKVTNSSSDAEVRKSIATSKTVGSPSTTAARNVVKAKKS